MTDRIPERIAMGHGRKEVDWLRIRTERGIGSSAAVTAQPRHIIQAKAIAADNPIQRPRTPALVLGERNNAMVVFCYSPYSPGMHRAGTLPRAAPKPKYRTPIDFAFDDFPPYNGAKVARWDDS